MANFNSELNPLRKAAVVLNKTVQVGSVITVQHKSTGGKVRFVGLPILDLVAGTKGAILLIVQNPDSTGGDDLFMAVDPAEKRIINVIASPMKLAPALWVLVAAHYALMLWQKQVKVAALHSRLSNRRAFAEATQKLAEHDSCYKALVRMYLDSIA